MRAKANEVKLLKKCLEGDATAFEVIVAEYQDLICAITYSGVTDIHRSEELAHQTFINAWTKLSQLKDLSKFRPWLCTIARNHVKSSIREKKRDILQKAKSMEHINETAADGSGPLESVIKKEHIELVDAAIGQMPELYREPLVLFYRQGQSVKQVALSLDLSQNAVKQRLRRGREMIKGQLSSIVEETLSATGPKKAFTAAVGASIAGLAVKGSGVAAAGVAGASATAGTSASVATIMGGMTAKIIAAVVVIAIGIGAVAAYKQINKTEQTSTGLPAAIVVEKEKDAKPQNTPDKAVEEVTEQVVEIEIPDEAIELAAAGVVDASPSKVEDVKPVTVSAESALAESDKYVFKPKGVLSGLVTDAKTGEPVTDAELMLGGSGSYTTKTDKNGYYSFQTKIRGPGSFTIGVSSVEYVGIEDHAKRPMIYLKEDSHEVKHFKLDKACMLDVWVVDEQGQPLKGARVIATSLAGNRLRMIGTSTRILYTDKKGYILLGGFASSPSPYLITVKHDREKIISKKNGLRHVELIPNYAAAGVRVVLNDPDIIASTEVVLKKGTSVKGYAEYLDGIPVGGLKIVANPDWWHCSSYYAMCTIDPNGFFKMDQIVPGKYNLQINIPTGEGSSIGKHLFLAQLPLPVGELLEVTLPEKSPGSLVSISGTVTIKGDKIPSHAEVTAYSRQFGHHSCQLDFGHGKDKQTTTTFCLDRLEPDTYRLQFSGSGIEPVTMENVQAPADDIEVELVAAGKPRMIGMVIDGESSKPIKNFKIRAKKLKTHRGSNSVQSNRWIDFRDKEGTFEIEAVGPGLYQVQISAQGYAAQWSTEIDTDNNEAVMVELNKGGTVAGTVKDFKGYPVPDATVIPLSIAAGTNMRTKDIFVSTDGSVQTNKQGQFTLSHLAEGNETLKVIHPDYADEIVQDVFIQIGQVTKTPPVILGKGAAIEGFVYDASGNGKSGVTLYFQDKSGYGSINARLAGRLGAAVTDPNGFYRIENLPEKMCHVRFQDSSKYLGVIRRNILPENGKVSRLDFGGGPVVRGQLIIDGLPLANRKVLLGSVSSPTFGYFKCLDRTNVNGEFKFSGSTVGKLAIYYEKADKRGKWIKVMVVDVKSDDIDLGVIPDKMAKVIVTIENADAESDIQIIQVMIQGETGLLGKPIGVAKAPVSEGEPYVIDNVPAGKHTLSIMCKDFFVIRKDIEIEKDATETKILFMMPKSTASISGKLTGDTRVVSFWSSDQKLTGTLIADEDGSFRTANLPAGKYLAGFNNSMKKKVIAEFELAEGQEKIIELDTSELQIGNIAILHIQIVDDNGIPFGSAEVWLASDGKAIEPYMNSDSEIIFGGTEGDYTLHVAHPDFKDVSMEVELKAQDLKTIRAKVPPLYIRLEPNR